MIFKTYEWKLKFFISFKRVSNVFSIEAENKNILHLTEFLKQIKTCQTFLCELVYYFAKEKRIIPTTNSVKYIII